MVGDTGAVIQLIVGIFGGIAVFLAVMYSMTQVLLLSGPGRWVHAAQFLLVMAAMTVLFWWRDAAAARLFAWPLIPVAIWCVWGERRWYRIFPVLILAFALALATGYVALTPL